MRLRTSALICLFALSAPLVVAAQDQPPTPRTPPPGRAPSAAPPPQTPTPPPATAPTPEIPNPRIRRGQDLNVQVEITISDQVGSSAPEKKTVSLMAADQTFGRVRASAQANKAGVGFVGTNLNVDGRPTVLANDRILLELTLEYTPLRDTQVTQGPTNLNESVSVILQNGKPMTISQAADPISDRRMTVEVKATIVR